jgi:hypothetical protein
VPLLFVVFFEKASSLNEVGAFMIGAFALLFLKDPKDGKATSDK